tara:strand:- start:185 stop:499 length:315 start_codon:yes stop_codon:yes gene_type:complete
VEAEAVKAAVNHDKELRKAISAMEMNFNSGVANLKKVLDELKDTPNLLAGRAPGLTSNPTPTPNPKPDPDPTPYTLTVTLTLHQARAGLDLDAELHRDEAQEGN